MTNNPKPVTILTGFLGAGKTTLLNAILQKKKLTRFAIIENEVGEIGIDGDLIVKNTDSFTEINNGCICCSLNDNFIDTLRKITQREDWDELIIEATGVANPGGIIAPFKQFPWLQKYFQLPHVICLADGANIKSQLKHSETTASQLAYADKIYINKTDLITQEEFLEVHALVRSFNPLAGVHQGNKESVPVSELLQKAAQHENIFETEHEHHHHEHFNAISLEYEASFDEDKLYARLYTFLMVQSSNVFRFKGIFYDARKSNKLIAQSVMQSLFIDEGEPWGEQEVKKSRFVFIGKNLQEKGFDKMLKSCQL